MEVRDLAEVAVEAEDQVEEGIVEANINSTERTGEVLMRRDSTW